MKSDATVTIQGNKLTPNKALDGGGVMTIIGGGSNTLSITWNCAVSGSTCNGIVAQTGTVDITYCTLTLTGLGTASASEYVLVDYSAANGYLLGSAFKATNGLSTGWAIDYDGTTAHPEAVVLVAPATPGTVFTIR